MPLNGSGSYTPPAADFPAVAGTVIESAKYNNVTNDIASAISTAIMKDGQSTVAADIPFGNKKITGLGLGTARTDAASLANIQDSAGIYISSVSGTANAIVLSPSPAITAYAAGQTFYFLATAENTAAATVAISGLAAKAIVSRNNIALTPGNIRPGLVEITYDGTSFRLISINYLRFGEDVSTYDPTGVSDSTSALAANFTAMGAAGGTLHIANGDVVLVDTNLTIPANCHLVGPHKITGTPGSNADAPYDQLGGVIYLNSTATITPMSGASISGLYIIRKGMTFPAQDSSAYAGTAITCAGDDVYVSARVIGFKKAFVANGYARIKLDLDFDCDPTAGDGAVELTALHDSSYAQLHGWPFGTIEAYSTATSGGTVNQAANAYRLQRAGNGLKVRGEASDLTLSGLIYGYKTNWDVASTGNLQFGICWGDNTGYYTGSKGFNFGSATDGICAVMLRAFSNEQNIVIAMDSETKFEASILHAQQGTSDGITLSGGDISVGQIICKSNAGAAINITTTNTRLHADSLSDYANTYANPIKLSVDNIRYEDVDIGGVISDKAAGTKLVGGFDTKLYQLASASTINIPIRPDVFYVTGTTNIDTLNGLNGGREITLIFEGVLTVNSGTGNINMGSNFTTNARSVLKLIVDPHHNTIVQTARNQN